MFNYTLSNESVMVIVDGKAHTVRKGVPNFIPLVTAILSDDEAGVREHLTVKHSLEVWAKGKFTIEGNTVKYNGQALPESLNKRMVEMATKGESPEPLFLFWEKLQQNPSMRSVEQLYTFLNHCGIPLAADGDFLAYKGVKDDLTDCHTGKISNAPGVVNEMPRNQISDDPRTPCHVGFHVGALGYAGSFGPQTVICKVNPRDVVCVPYDASSQKMRVCRYEVIGFHGSQLSNTTHEDENDPTPEECIDEDRCEGENPECECKTAETDSFGSAAPSPEAVAQGRYAELDALDTKGLLQRSIAELREYAGKGLKIIGASKIPGGKTSLIKRILKVRNRKA